MARRDMTHYPYGQGTRHVYLIHFSRPLGHASHYIGQTDRDVETRFREHCRGKGARICKKAVEAGIKLTLARVWLDAPRCFEQKLKNRANAKHFCPICSGDAARGRAVCKDSAVVESRKPRTCCNETGSMLASNGDPSTPR